jgi:hypothetical protein
MLRSVSIPFIAGQWSLLRRRGGASRGRTAEEHVSIPFIAGQWSLQAEDCLARREVGGAWVSIPFIAGQWSLPQLCVARRRAGRSR